MTVGQVLLLLVLMFLLFLFIAESYLVKKKREIDDRIEELRRDIENIDIETANSVARSFERKYRLTQVELEKVKEHNKHLTDLIIAHNEYCPLSASIKAHSTQGDKA